MNELREVATAFEQGYSKGEKQRHKDVRQEGFNAAFTYTTYHSPSAYQTNTRLLESYKEGFQSNKVANQLRKDAYEEGWKLGDAMTIPAKEILQLKKSPGGVNLYYSAKELPNGRVLASVNFGNKNTTSLKQALQSNNSSGSLAFTTLLYMLERI